MATKVAVVANAPGAENFTDAGPLVIVHATVIGSSSGSVACPKSVRSFAGNARTFAGPASITGGSPEARTGTDEIEMSPAETHNPKKTFREKSLKGILASIITLLLNSNLDLIVLFPL